MAYYEVTPASNSMQPDLHKRNHVAQTSSGAWPDGVSAPSVVSSQFI